MPEKLYIGMAGFGTVGRGVYTVLKRNAEIIERRSGQALEIKTIVCRDIKKAHDFANEANIVNDLNAIIDDPEISIAVEVMGGIKPAKSFILNAIRNGKDVVTANKALLATHGDEIFREAQKHNRRVYFEASVAGGIPIIKALREGLAANQIFEITGILNGTCNYILSSMHQSPVSFEDALKEAQKLGYAEADPTFDIEGLDTGHKLTILSALAFGTPYQFDSSRVCGITSVSSTDVKYAQKFGFVIKLLAIARKNKDNISFSVSPTLVPENTFLAHVNAAMNAVEIKSDALGTSFYYGAGAGGEPTASAVLADLVDLARGNQVSMPLSEANSVALMPIDAVNDKNYIRLHAPLINEKAGLVEQIFKQFDIRIDKEMSEENNLVFITHECSENRFSSASDRIRRSFGETIAIHVMKIKK